MAIVRRCIAWGALIALGCTQAVAQIQPAAGGSGSGTVSSVATNNGLTGGTITTTGTVGLAAIPNGNFLCNNSGASAVPVYTNCTPGTGVAADFGNPTNATGGFLDYSIIGTSGGKVPLLNGANTNSAEQTIALGAITSNTAALALTASLNASGTKFDAPLFENITNSASAAGSLIADLQYGGVTALGISASTASSTYPAFMFNATGAAPTTLPYGTSDPFDFQGGRINLTNIAGGATVAQYRVNGTVGSPTAITAGQNVGANIFGGYDGTALATGAELAMTSLNNWSHGSDTSAYLRFYVTASGASTIAEQMRLQASGGLSLGNSIVSTDPGNGSLLLAGSIAAKNVAADTGQTDASLCFVSSTGQFYYGTGVAGICLGTSSARYKHDIEPLAVGLNDIMGLVPVSYRLNADHGGSNKVLYGFTAEQGASVLPALVGNDAQGRPNTFDYLGVVPVLVHAVQQLQAEVEDLRVRLPR